MAFTTVLFTPANRPERVIKAWQTQAADVVVSDLEDAIAPADKQAALGDVVAALEATNDATGRAVRINQYPGELASAELAAVIPLQPEFIVVPKCESAELLHDLVTHIAGIHGDFGSKTRIIAIIETAAGVLAAREIAAVPEVAAVAFGAEDLAADAGMRRTPSNKEVEVPRALVALACAAEGKPAIDMITPDFKDAERTTREAVEARNLGYAGKMCLHPAQVAAVQEAFKPSAEELAWAKQVMAAVEANGNHDGGVVVVNGRMIDVPLIRQAKRILASQ